MDLPLLSRVSFKNVGLTSSVPMLLLGGAGSSSGSDGARQRARDEQLKLAEQATSVLHS